MSAASVPTEAGRERGGRVGVLGGTFDPLHLGHLRAAAAVGDALALDKILFVPAASPPHKSVPDVTEAHHRVAMVRCAVASESGFELSLVEIERVGPSYTVDTLRELRRGSPETRFCFIAGTDAFVEIQTWKDWRELLDGFAFAVHERPGFATERVKEVAPEGARFVGDVPRASGRSPGLEGGLVFLVRRPMLQVSSTEVRELVREGRSIRYLVPHSVEDYIKKNRLYEQG